EEKLVKDFLQGAIRTELLAELAVIPDDTTFIYGHTHKPFEQNLEVKGFPAPVKLYNNGGWVVDTEELDRNSGGAVLLVDDNLDVVSLRMYNETGSPADYVVRAASLDEATPLYFQV